MTPKYLKDNLTPHRLQLYGAINPSMLRNIFCNTTRYMNSFFPDSIRIWNSIGKELQTASSVAIFNRQIINLIRPVSKSTFGIFDALGLRYLFQLRLNLSPLKSHKKRYNFDGFLNDWCDCSCAPEDTSHFFFHCPLFYQQRLNLINSITLILRVNPDLCILNNTQLLLYGHRTLTFNDNKNILLMTIKFIKESGRLDK